MAPFADVEHHPNLWPPSNDSVELADPLVPIKGCEVLFGIHWADTHPNDEPTISWDTIPTVDDNNVESTLRSSIDSSASSGTKKLVPPDNKEYLVEKYALDNSVRILS